jgi:hypothetical protein
MQAAQSPDGAQFPYSLSLLKPFSSSIGSRHAPSCAHPAAPRTRAASSRRARWAAATPGGQRRERRRRRWRGAVRGGTVARTAARAERASIPPLAPFLHCFAIVVEARASWRSAWRTRANAAAASSCAPAQRCLPLVTLLALCYSFTAQRDRPVKKICWIYRIFRWGWWAPCCVARLPEPYGVRPLGGLEDLQVEERNAIQYAFNYFQIISNFNTERTLP